MVKSPHYPYPVEYNYLPGAICTIFHQLSCRIDKSMVTMETFNFTPEVIKFRSGQDIPSLQVYYED